MEITAVGGQAKPEPNNATSFNWWLFTCRSRFFVCREKALWCPERKPGYSVCANQMLLLTYVSPFCGLNTALKPITVLYTVTGDTFS